jgi:hypothetical protein
MESRQEYDSYLFGTVLYMERGKGLCEYIDIRCPNLFISHPAVLLPNSPRPIHGHTYRISLPFSQ